MRIFLKLPRVRLPGDNTGQLVPSSVRHGHQNNIREWDNKNRKLLNKKEKKKAYPFSPYIKGQKSISSLRF